MKRTGLTAPKGQILIHLKSLANFDELFMDKNFHEWFKVAFSSGLLGFDNIDVYNLVESRRATLKVLVGRCWSEIISEANNNINSNAHGVVIGALVPLGYEVHDIKTILEQLAEHMNPDAQILFQAVRHKKKQIRMYCLEIE